MKCLVTGGNVKVLGKAIHSLSRIGDEVYFQPLEDGLSLRSVNLSRSAYGCFLFAPLFFQFYEYTSCSDEDQDTNESFRCKVLMKSVLNVFRSLSSLEKTVEKCRISLNPKTSRLVIQLLCKYGVVKTHNLSFQECESLQAVFSKDVCPNVLRAPARVLVDAVVHFPVTLSEVTLAPSCGGRVIFRNYLEEETDPSKMMLTEMTLNEDEFLHFQISKESEITFCLKEFRGLLSFAESSSLPVSIHFDIAGRPVVFSLEDPVLEVHFVLATLSEQEVSGSQKLARGSCTKDDTRLPPSEAAADDFLSDDIDSYMIAMETTTVEEATANGCQPPHSPTFPLKGSGRAEGSSSILLKPGGRRKDLSMLSNNKPGSESEEEEEEPGEVPGTPPNKKFRSLFFGSVLSQRDALHHTGLSEEVLAEASDVEEES
ncbi:cell cycle checkpoint control protein RAD9A isoform X1 [Microcaecilia unicolor]|uniref:Cell cycle checkpoint control protein n=1 Tax=Microcaecilia unicolor TaxID=1415580 RepID=A0A6P7WKQ8_9AMPH|nr:cell cycle checkpoint control protein RAD9A isoform X1 [Microcaecilia unicolor]